MDVDVPDNPKCFWSYVNNKIKSSDKIGDLVTVQNGTKVIADTAHLYTK